MKIEIAKNVVAFGRNCRPGEVLEVAERHRSAARYLIATGAAMPLPEDPAGYEARTVKKTQKRIIRKD